MGMLNTQVQQRNTYIHLIDFQPFRKQITFILTNNLDMKIGV